MQALGMQALGMQVDSDAAPVQPPAKKMKRIKYNVLAWRTMEDFAIRLQEAHPDQFSYHQTKWGKFEDSRMDHIKLGGFHPNVLQKSHVIFIASFDDNDAMMSQFHALIVLCESFVKTLTILLPYYPVATMERITEEGEIATANTTARMLSNLPSIGWPARVMFYDLHTLQNRFYLHSNAIATLHTAIPLIKAVMAKANPPFTAIAFPDEGAQKRFAQIFGEEWPVVTCGKQRIGETRHVVVQDGQELVKGSKLLIIDDMVKTGGTLATCAESLMALGCSSISAYCTHAGFPEGAAQRFCRGGDRAVFEKFYVTNSNPIVSSQLPTDDCIEVLDLLPLFIADLNNGPM